MVTPHPSTGQECGDLDSDSEVCGYLACNYIGTQTLTTLPSYISLFTFYADWNGGRPRPLKKLLSLEPVSYLVVVSLWSENSRTWIDELSFRTKMKKLFIINIFIRREKEEIMIVFIYQTKNPLRLLQLKNFYPRSYLTLTCGWHIANEPSWNTSRIGETKNIQHLYYNA